MYLSALHGHGHILLTSLERSTDCMHTGHNALSVGIDLLVNGQSDARHDTHVNDNIG